VTRYGYASRLQQHLTTYYDVSINERWSSISDIISATTGCAESLAGDIPFHCHLVDHEDNGMMAVLRVLPSATRPHLGRASQHAKQMSAATQ
jgi:hypothetical protein